MNDNFYLSSHDSYLAIQLNVPYRFTYLFFSFGKFFFFLVSFKDYNDISIRLFQELKLNIHSNFQHHLTNHFYV